MIEQRPHVLGIDDAPFVKGQSEDVPIVGVLMEGATLVEGVAIGAFPVDGEGATAYLAEWVSTQRWHAALQAVVLGGITIAGLGVVDVGALAEQLSRPVMAVTRRPTQAGPLEAALRAAGLAERIETVRRTPTSRRAADGLFVGCAGVEPHRAARLVRATCSKARVPEPLRVAHLVGAALVHGTSRGRA